MLSKDAEVLKIIQRGIDESHAQLPTGAAGLLIVRSDEANRFRLLEEDFRGAFRSRRSLGGVMVMDSVQRAQFIANPYALTPIGTFAILRILMSQAWEAVPTAGG